MGQLAGNGGKGGDLLDADTSLLTRGWAAAKLCERVHTNSPARAPLLMSAIPYRDIRHDAFFLTEIDARSQTPPIEVHLRDIDRKVLEVWSATWSGRHPSGYGAFPWARLYFSHCRSERAFHVSLWSEEILCGLAIGAVPRDHSTLTLHYMAGKQNPPNPLKGRVMGIVATAAEYYAVGLQLPRIEIENPAPGLVDAYRVHGYNLAYTRQGIRYLAKQF